MITTPSTDAEDADIRLRPLSGWGSEWEPLRKIEAQITTVWAKLRALRVQAAEERARLRASCPVQLSELEYRFWSKVGVIDDEDSCWEWTSSRRPVVGEEYGLFRFDGNGRDTGGTIGAHRMAYVLTHGGELPDHARHTCDNPPCCRPRHLLDGTHADNMVDKALRGRARGKANQRGEANDSAVLTDQIVLEARRRYREGESQGQLAEAFFVDRAALGYAIRGATWAHLDEIEPPSTGRPGGGVLTEDDVRAIRAEHAAVADPTRKRDLAGRRAIESLSERYDVTPANIYAIVRRKSWKHVD